MIYALIGGEPFLIRRALEKLLAERLASSAREFNFDALEGGEVEARRVMELARLLPVLAPRRVVLLRNADALRKGEGDKLSSFLSQIPETTDLILTAERADQRLLFWQRVGEIGKVREFRSLYHREVVPWVQEEVAKAGYRVDLEAARWLVESLGTDLSLVHSTLEKLYLLKGGERDISLEDLLSCVNPFSWRSVFDLVDAVAKRDLPQSLRLFKRMFTAGESPIALLGQLAWHLRTLSKVKEGEVKGISPFFLKKYQAQAGQFPMETLNEKRERLFLADWALKSSPVSTVLLFERLLMDLCR